MNNIIADRVKGMDASGIRKIWQLAQKMTDPVNFSIGEPDFDVPDPIKDVAISAIKQGKNGYTLTTGIPELREKIAEKVTAETGWEDPQIIVTCGVSGCLTLTLNTLVNPGDDVLIPDPYFVIYDQMTGMCGGNRVYIDTYPDFNLTGQRLEEAITPGSKILFVNSPSNPSGIVYQPEHLKEIAEVARKNNLIVLSDEIYREFSYDGPAETIAKYYENTIIMGGFSKSHGAPGWRLGYLALPKHLSEVYDKMAALQQYTMVCAPHPFQLAAIAAIDYPVDDLVAQYKKKRDMIFDGLSEKFGMIKPGGAFYAFVPAPNGNASDYVMKAIENDVLIIPGKAFSQKDTHFRISYATSNEKIEKGLERLIEIL